MLAHGAKAPPEVTQTVEHDYRTTSSIPPGLIGPRCAASVFLESEPCESIMDSGSQVTTISESFHKNCLSHLPIQPINALLEIEGAGGQHVPYLGYIEARLTLPQSITGKEEELVVLALVVPECNFNSKIPLLIGTNALSILYEQLLERDGPEFTGRLHSQEFALILQHIAQTHESDIHTCPVKLHGKGPITIPAKQRYCVMGNVRVKKNSQNTSFVIEPHEQFKLPGGLFLEAALVDVPFKANSKVPVVLHNLSEHSVKLLPKSVIAQVCSVHCITPLGPSHSVPHSDKPDNDHLNFDLDESPISQQWKKRILAKLRSIPEVFALDDLSYGHTNAVKHHIRLQDEMPFKERPRPIHPSDREAVKQHLKELLDAGIIRESESPFASPIVLVRKKNGSIRLCIDYRKLNARTIRDAYALPNIEETFAALSGAKWFSVMDLKSGYYQVEVAEEDKAKTAFVCPLGFFEFNRMPQGVTNAPSTFQRLMERCVGDLHLNEVLVFLDDLIVFSDTLEEHEVRPVRVLNRLKDFGLKLSPEKCHFFQTSVKYLGHVVDAQGVHTDPDKISALRDWPRPSNQKELKRFLGFAGYYRRFVEGYSQIAKPLNNLTVGYYPPKKRGKVYKREHPKSSVCPNQPLAESWTPECENAFQELIKKLTSAPILAFADPQLPYVLHTDACSEGLGAALYQEQEGKLRVIAYASRGLSKSERNYPAHKLEFLALKWAVCEKFNDYLYGSSFTVLTDNNPLTYVLTSARLDATGHRWLAALSTYQFTIKYRAGHANRDADGLSRRPQAPPVEDENFIKERERINGMKQRLMGVNDELGPEVFSALCQRHLVAFKGTPHSSKQYAVAECLAIDPSSALDFFGEDTLPSMTSSDWCQAQRQDPSISRVITFLERGLKPSFRESNLEPPDVKLLLREWRRLELTNGLLYRKWIDKGKPVYQLVRPQQFRERALQGVHDEVGHLGFERALHLARARFYWPKMAKCVEEKCKKCVRCIRRKAVPQKAAPLENISATYPLQLVCMDYLSIEPDNRDTRNVLVITDHFTKFAVAVTTKDQKAKTIAKALWENFIVHYGFPSRLLSDQGRDFESKTIKELCALIQADKIRTTPYHPRGNPVERFNRTLLDMLGTLEEKDKHHWRDFVKPLVHAYNCTRNDTTGYSPYELMFGRQPRLPIDLVMGIHPGNTNHKTHSEYVKKLRQNLQESYSLAVKNSQKMGEKNKLRFDRKIKAAELFAGDRVLVKNVNIRGKHKLADRWEQDVHIVVERIKDSPVYVVKRETGGSHRTLHRDLLLPCGFLPVEDSSERIPQNERQKKMKLRNKLTSQTQVDTDIDDEEGMYSDEDELYPNTVIPQIITRGPLVQKETSLVRPQPFPVVTDTNVMPHTFTRTHETLATESQVETPASGSTDAVTQSHCRSTDHVVINIPEAEPTSVLTRDCTNHAQPESPDESTDDVALETQSRLRRSTRERRPPHRFTYDELGEPLILAVSSFLQALETAFLCTHLHTQLNMHEETHAV
uniref:Gypsy retrotransposon integrase-like protein 1 n=1 Tax=Stegastes partitus TaxID=144197 RepID=A0A3B4ZHB9_9TELE